MYGILVINYRLQINYYDIYDPWFFHPRSLCHDFYMCVYTRLLVLRPTSFNLLGMGSRGPGGGGGSLKGNDTAK